MNRTLIGKFKFFLLLLALAFGFLGCNQKDPYQAHVDLLGEGSELEFDGYKDGQFFYFTAGGYSCYNSQLKESVPSYKESVYFDGKQLCRTGNSCSEKVDCKNLSDITDFKMKNGNFVVYAYGRNYVYGGSLNEGAQEPDRGLASEGTIVERLPDSQSNENGGSKVIVYLLLITLAGVGLYIYAPEA